MTGFPTITFVGGFRYGVIPAWWKSGCDRNVATPQPMTSGQSVWDISPRGLSVRS